VNRISFVPKNQVSHLRRWLRHPVTGFALVVILAVSVVTLICLTLLDEATFSHPFADQLSDQLSELTIDNTTDASLGSLNDLLRSPAPLTQTLDAPPITQLDGLQVSPFLLGVVGKENAVAAPETETPIFDRDHVLTDAENRIDKQFEITASLKERVGFWFDVYSKYDQNHRIIHNQRFPWIIYKIVDVTDIINATEPRVRWLRNVKADKFVKLETAKVRKTIQKIAKGVGLGQLKEDEKPVAEALRGLGKNIRKSARLALNDIRVQTGQRNFFIDGLQVSPRYLSAMEKIFRAKKLPIELTRLPFVESSFNQEAMSKVGAGGIWQFMGNTGRKFLLVNGNIDERRSPFKASEAAAMLLKENHMILGHSWPLAITAWNHGPGGVRKACAAAHSKDLGTVIARYHSKSFDFASSNFYSEFLGALYAERYNDIVFGKVNRDTELTPMVVLVQRSVHINDVIRSSGLTKEEFLLMNPDLTLAQASNARLPVGFRIHLPERARFGVEQLVGLRGNSVARNY
jgi:membrane-bound lytic murein transglycosylase D